MYLVFCFLLAANAPCANAQEENNSETPSVNLEPDRYKEALRETSCPRKFVKSVCATYIKPDGSKVYDPEDCAHIFWEGNRYYLERNGQTVFVPSLSKPIIRSAGKSFEDWMITGQTVNGFVIRLNGVNFGPYDHERMDAGETTFVRSKDNRHFAFAYFEYGQWWAIVDGTARPIGNVAIKSVTFHPEGIEAYFEVAEGDVRKRLSFPTDSRFSLR